MFKLDTCQLPLYLRLRNCKHFVLFQNQRSLSFCAFSLVTTSQERIGQPQQSSQLKMSDSYTRHPFSDVEWASLPAAEDMIPEFIPNCVPSDKQFSFLENLIQPIPKPGHDRAYTFHEIFSNNSGQPPNAKVPIARLTPPNNKSSGGRVSQACENCHAQKAKCSGNRPTCHRCQETAVPCNYGDRKREKTLKFVHLDYSWIRLQQGFDGSFRQLSTLTCQVQIYECLLRELYPRLDIISAKKVDQTLREVSLTR